jgi:hypothetical protein
LGLLRWKLWRANEGLRKMNEKIDRGLTWYQRAIEWPDVVESNPVVEPYVNFDKQPAWLRNVERELSRQGLHLGPKKEIASITAQEAGKLLGQICANNYAIEGHLRGAAEKNNKTKVEQALLKKIKEGKDAPAAASALHKKHVSEALTEEYEKFKTSMLKKVREAFDEALTQPKYSEAAEFFLGFSKGLAKPGVKDGKLAFATDATQIYTEMFYHWQEVDRLNNVTELYDWLSKRGVPNLGDIDRLRTICKRIKYAPGKRGRPTKPRN